MPYRKTGASLIKGMSRRNIYQSTIKYHNKKTEIDGIVFDSRKEALRWHELKLMENAGLISDLRRQVPFH